MGRSAVLDGIQKAGGIGALKKVDRTQIRDRSAALPGGSDTGPHGSGLPPAGVSSGGGAPNMADALAAALQKRKKKVGDSGKSAKTSMEQDAKLTDVQMTKLMTMTGKCAADSRTGDA